MSVFINKNIHKIQEVLINIFCKQKRKRPVFTGLSSAFNNFSNTLQMTFKTVVNTS